MGHAWQQTSLLVASEVASKRYFNYSGATAFSFPALPAVQWSVGNFSSCAFAARAHVVHRAHAHLARLPRAWMRFPKEIPLRLRPPPPRGDLEMFDLH